MSLNYPILHLHSEYSVLDSLCKIREIVPYCKSKNTEYMAITDHGNISGHIEFFNTCKENEIKPILGCEFYLVDDIVVKKPKEPKYHIVVLAKNDVGYGNLIKLSTISYVDGFYYTPRVDFKTLSKFSDGLIITSACIRSFFFQAIKNGDKQKLEEGLQFAKKFGSDFYMEVMAIRNTEYKQYNKELVEFSKANNIPFIFTTDTHYLEKEDATVYGVLRQIRYNFDKDKLAGHEDYDYHLKERREMEDILVEFGISISDIETGFSNMDTLAKSIEYKEVFVPKAQMVSDDAEKKEFLKVVSGKWKTFQKRLTEEQKKVYHKRLQDELKVFIKRDLIPYTNVLIEIVEYCNKNKILKGPGRGSAVGSLVLNVLGITDVDPIKYGLIFERFFSIERKDLPDVDMDFDARKRDLVKLFLSTKYGKDRVVDIITYQTFKGKSTIRDVGKALGARDSFCNHISRFLDSGLTFAENIEANEKLKALFEDQQVLLNACIKVEGLIRSFGTHAAGVIITDGKAGEQLPLLKTRENIVAGWAEGQQTKLLSKIGFQKYDILSLNVLTMLQECLTLIGKDIGFLKEMPLDDPKVYAEFCKAETDDIFMFGTDGLKNLLAKFQPKNMIDLSVINALYRPAPLQAKLDEKILYRRNHPYEKFMDYDDAEIISILKDTYGFPIFQEQVMLLYSRVCRATLLEADAFRREIMKEKNVEKLEEYKKNFIRLGQEKSGMSLKELNDVWNIMKHTIQYSFNRSHSVAYSIISYYQMYLRVYYPLQFFCSVLSLSVEEKLPAIKERVMKTIKMDPVSLTKSVWDYSIDGEAIVEGFRSLKGIGDKTYDEIIRKRPYESYEHFCAITEKRIVNKRIKAIMELAMKKGEMIF